MTTNHTMEVSYSAGEKLLAWLKFWFFIVPYCWIEDTIKLCTVKAKNIEGQIVVITGAASGLGFELTKQLSVYHKAHVVMLDINQEALDRKRLEIINNGGEASAFVCDCTSYAQMRQVADIINAEHGHTDIVISNAGIVHKKFFTEQSSRQLGQQLDVNLMGQIWTIKAFLPDMLEHDAGQIVSVISVTAYGGGVGGSAYASSKFAMRGFMETLETDLASKRSNIKVTCVYPWFIETPLLTGQVYRCRMAPILTAERTAECTIDALLKEERARFISRIFGWAVTFRWAAMAESGRQMMNRALGLYVGPIDKMPEYMK